jgi:hypothetical protein
MDVHWPVVAELPDTPVTGRAVSGNVEAAGEVADDGAGAEGPMGGGAEAGILYPYCCAAYSGVEVAMS